MTTAAPPPAPAPVRRLPVVLTLAALALAGGLLDRIPPSARTRDGSATAAPAMPQAAPATALSSTWFCAAGTAADGGVGGIVAEGTISVANAGDRLLHGTITAVPIDGPGQAMAFEVGPRARAVIPQRKVLQAPFVASVVEVDGGEVAVEHEIAGPSGASAAPCASAASDRWYLAEGSTAREGANPEDRMLLALFNPFPEDAIVDLAFATDQGRAVPSDFTGLVVKGGRVRLVEVGTRVRRRANIATTAVARSGRIVIDRIQQRNGSIKGLSLALAAPSPGPRWYFPEGFVGDGVAERYHLYNPTNREAQVSIELALDQGAAEPFDLTVAPRERLTVNASDEERVPRNVAHAATVVSLNGVPVVAERTVVSSPPAARAGVSDSLGARRTARRWVLAAGSANDAIDEWVIVHNPGPGDAVVSMRALASGQLLAVESLQGIAVPAGRRTAVRVTDHVKRDDLPFLVTATVPVVVERALYRIGSPGVALNAGIPLD